MNNATLSLLTSLHDKDFVGRQKLVVLTGKVAVSDSDSFLRKVASQEITVMSGDHYFYSFFLDELIMARHSK